MRIGFRTLGSQGRACSARSATRTSTHVPGARYPSYRCSDPSTMEDSQRKFHPLSSSLSLASSFSWLIKRSLRLCQRSQKKAWQLRSW